MSDERAKIVLSAEDRTREAFASAQRNIGALKTSAVGISAAFGPLLGAVGLLGAAISAISFKSLLNGIDALNDVKDATGASIENISALEDVADRTGTTLDTVSTSLVKFNKVLTEAKPGSGIAETLKLIGVNAEELKKLDPAEALRQTAVALDGYAENGKKARIVQEFFGKSIKEVGPFLKDLAEQGSLNAKVTKAQAEEAEKFNKQLFIFQTNVKDAARSIVSDMLPALNKFFDKLKEGRVKGGFFASVFKEFEANMAADKLRVVTAEVIRLDGYIKKQGASADPRLVKYLAKLREEATGLSREAAAASEALKAMAPAPAVSMDFGPEVWKGDAPNIVDTAAAKAAAQEALATMRRLIDGNVKALDAGLEATRDELKFNEQQSQILYGQGLQSLEKFYADQDKARQDDLAAVRANTAAKIAERQKELDSPLLKGPDKASEREGIRTEIAEARKQLAAAEREASQSAKLSVLERTRATEALRDEVAGLDAQIRDLASGKSVNVDLLNIAERVREAGRTFVKGGASDEEAARRAAEYGKQLEIQRQLTQVRENFGEVTTNAARAEEMLLLNAQKTGEGMLTTEAKVGDSRAKALAQLDELVATTRELLELNPGNSALIDYLKEIELQAERARASVDPKLLRFDAAAKEAGEAIAGSFEDAIVDGGKLGDILKSLEKDLIRIVTRETLTKPLGDAFSGFLSSLGGGGGGGGNVQGIGDKYNGSSAGGIGGLISSIAGIFGFDEGGYTGNAGRKQAVGVVHGEEFVFSAPATKRIGVDVLEQLHEHAKSGRRLRGFESGGYVGAQASQWRRPQAPADARTWRQNRPVTQILNFTVNGPISNATQKQLAREAGLAIQGAMARNG